MLDKQMTEFSQAWGSTKQVCQEKEAKGTVSSFKRISLTVDYRNKVGQGEREKYGMMRKSDKLVESKTQRCQRIVLVRKKKEGVNWKDKELYSDDGMLKLR